MSLGNSELIFSREDVREGSTGKISPRPQGMMKPLGKNQIYGKETVRRDYKGRSLLWGLGGISPEPVKRPESIDRCFLPVSS